MRTAIVYLGSLNGLELITSGPTGNMNEFVIEIRSKHFCTCLLV